MSVFIITGGGIAAATCRLIAERGFAVCVDDQGNTGAAVVTQIDAVGGDRVALDRRAGLLFGRRHPCRRHPPGHA